MTAAGAAAAEQPPICGWRAIAAEVSRALGREVCVRTVQRYSRQGRDNRLPTREYPNRRVYLKPSHLAAWATIERDGVPTGGRIPGRPAPVALVLRRARPS